MVAILQDRLAIGKEPKRSGTSSKYCKNVLDCDILGSKLAYSFGLHTDVRITTGLLPELTGFEHLEKFTPQQDPDYIVTLLHFIRHLFKEEQKETCFVHS